MIYRWLGILACVLLVACLEPVHAAPFTATFVTKGPAPIGECDKLEKSPKVPARAVYSLSIWQREGWPLWRNVCYWNERPKNDRRVHPHR